MNHPKPEKLWFGTESSLNEYLIRHEQPIPPELVAKYAARDDEDEEDEDDIYDDLAKRLIEVYGSVGVVNVRGSLVAEEHWANPWFGDVAYSTITRAVNMLLEDEDVKSIVIAYDTGGGDAQGVQEAGQAISNADTQKPVYAFANVALSAGQWLASSARKTYASQMSQLGSIGAVAAFVGIAPRMKESGYEVFLARSAEKKAVPNRLEPLTEVGKKVLTDSVKTAGGFFVDHMLRARPALSSASSKEWASGEVFWGQRAVELGLCDGLMGSVSDLVQLAEAVHNAQTETSTPSNYYTKFSSGGDMAKKLILSDLGAARVSMGLTPEGTPTTPEIELVQPHVMTTGLTATTTTPDPAPEPEPDAAITASAPLQDGLSTYLKEELHALKEENAQLKANLQDQATLKADLNLQQATVAHLRPVAEAAVKRLAIGLGHRPLALEALPADLLAKTFAELQTELMALPAGRQTAEPTTDVIEGDQQPDTLMQHRLRLVPQAQSRA